MKAVVVKEFYRSLSEVHVSPVPPPIPRPDEILIKVIAAGVNFVDTLYVCRYLSFSPFSDDNELQKPRQ